MSNANYQTIIKTVDSFPPLPATVSKVLQVVDDPESSAHDLMNAILPDQSMCAAILKVANSAFFGRPKQVSSLETAVMVLGFNEIQSIVLGKAVFDSFKHISTNNEFIEYFWKHSFSCGLASKILAENFFLSPGNSFIGGLLHDIGKLALLLSFPSNYDPEVMMGNNFSSDSGRTEEDIFSISHDKLAARLLRRWLFPEPLVATVEFHHSPELSETHKTGPLIVYTADKFTYCSDNPEIMVDNNIIATLETTLPSFKDLWKDSGLKFEEKKIEECFISLQKEQDTGNTLMSIIAS